MHLRDRAFDLLSQGEPVDDEALLAHVYGGAPPAALRARLLAPMLEDPRFGRTADGRWTIAARPSVPISAGEVTALALTVTGPNPARARVLRVSALHVTRDGVAARFSATVNPGKRVPSYVAERAGLATDVLDELMPFQSIADDLTRFLDDRPVCAQEAQMAWGFLSAELRRLDRAAREPLLLDVNDLAHVLLDLDGKPTLAAIAKRLGISFTRIEHADEEARVLALVVPHLLRVAQDRGITSVAEVASTSQGHGVLAHAATARDLPETSGVYVMRDAHQQAVYVGKARRLRQRVGAYVHRPLGAMRRLEGLQAAVQTVDAQECQTDLEALILEDREIRRLQPRFNTVRQQRVVRTWLRLRPWPAPRRGQRPLAPPRLELVVGPEVGAGEFIGPFRNETLAQHARGLARAIFDLDGLRLTNVQRYVKTLPKAWAFLQGELDDALAAARAAHAGAVAQGDVRAARVWEQRIADVREYDPHALRLPADPRHVRYAVVRPGPNGIEGFVLDRGLLLAWQVFDANDDAPGFAQRLLAQQQPRTTPADVDVVLRWLGAQRAGARLVLLPADALAASDAIEDAVAALLSGDVA